MPKQQLQQLTKKWKSILSEVSSHVNVNTWISAGATAVAVAAAELTKKCKSCKMSKQVLSFPSAHAHLPDRCRLCKGENTALSMITAIESEWPLLKEEMKFKWTIRINSIFLFRTQKSKDDKRRKERQEASFHLPPGCSAGTDGKKYLIWMILIFQNAVLWPMGREYFFQWQTSKELRMLSTRARWDIQHQNQDPSTWVGRLHVCFMRLSLLGRFSAIRTKN